LREAGPISYEQTPSQSCPGFRAGGLGAVSRGSARAGSTRPPCIRGGFRGPYSKTATVVCKATWGEGLGLRVSSLEFRVEGLESRIQGFGCGRRVPW